MLRSTQSDINIDKMTISIRISHYKKLEKNLNQINFKKK